MDCKWARVVVVAETCHGFLIILFGFASVCVHVAVRGQVRNAQLIDSQNITCHTSNRGDLLSQTIARYRMPNSLPIHRILHFAA